MIPATTAAGILTYIWPFVTTKGGYIAVALVYGCVSFCFLFAFNGFGVFAN